MTGRADAAERLAAAVVSIFAASARISQLRAIAARVPPEHTLRFIRELVAEPKEEAPDVPHAFY